MMFLDINFNKTALNDFHDLLRSIILMIKDDCTVRQQLIQSFSSSMITSNYNPFGVFQPFHHTTIVFFYHTLSDVCR